MIWLYVTLDYRVTRYNWTTNFVSVPLDDIKAKYDVVSKTIQHVNVKKQSAHLIQDRISLMVLGVDGVEHLSLIHLPLGNSVHMHTPVRQDTTQKKTHSSILGRKRI